MTRVLMSAVNPEQILLFGSRAQGEARDDSDLDLFIIERKSFGPSRSRSQEIRRIPRIFSDFRIPKDILVTDLTRWLNGRTK